MLDVHCHILPGVDDGARTFDDAVAMARVLGDAGFEAVAPSPHFGAGPGGDVSVADAQRVRGELAERLREEGVELELLPNAEHHLTPELFERAAAGNVAPIGGAGKWLLVELPWAAPPDPEDALFRLQSKGYELLLAHPERHDYLAMERLERLVHRGVRLQLEIGSFVRLFGRSAKLRAIELADRGLAHVLASDMHAPADAQTWLRAGLRAVADRYGRRAVEIGAASNPRAMVDDASPDDVAPLAVAR